MSERQDAHFQSDCVQEVTLACESPRNGNGGCQLVSSLLVSQAKRIAVLAGDGIGREVIPEAIKVLSACGAAIEIAEFDWGAGRYLADRVTVPADGFDMLERDF